MQRQGRRINHIRDVNETIGALNWMAGVSYDGSAFRPSLRQLEVLDRVGVACRDALSLPDGATAPISSEAAFRELLRGSSVYERLVQPWHPSNLSVCPCQIQCTTVHRSLICCQDTPVNIWRYLSAC